MPPAKNLDLCRSSGNDDSGHTSSSMPLKHRINFRPRRIACSNDGLESQQITTTENPGTFTQNVTNELGMPCQMMKSTPCTSVIGALLCADSSDSDSIDDLQAGESKLFNFECCPPSEYGDSIRSDFISASRYNNKNIEFRSYRSTELHSNELME